MQYAHKTSKLVIGKYYLVAHAVLLFDGDDKEYHVPVLPHLHSDPQFGKAGEFEHYHIDGRFIRSKHMDTWFDIDDDGKTNQVVYIQNEFPYLGNYIVKTVLFKKCKCKRLTTGVKPPVKYPFTIDHPYLKWYNGFIGKQCKGKKCPHFGTTMIDNGNGLLVCPMHDLHADGLTQKIIEHPERGIRL